MKKIVLSLLLLASMAGAHAQIGTDFGVNMFVTINGGMSFCKSGEAEMGSGFAGGIGVGKWILSPLAGRVDLDFMTAPSPQDPDVVASYAAATMEFLWDPMSTFSRIRDWRVNVYPLIGLGIIYRAGDNTHATDREVQGMLGLNVPVHLSLGWDVYLEYKCFFIPETFDAGGRNLMQTATVGFNHRFTESPYTRRTEFESRDVGDDWFLGFGIGPNYSLFDLFSNEHLGGLSMIGVAPEAMFGRNFSNFWTIRFELTGLSAHEQFDTVKEEPGDAYSFTMLHADVMMNLSHLLDFKRGVKWNFLPYLGAGAIWRYDNPMFDMAADFGIMARRYINAKGDFFIDLKYLLVAPRIGGGTGPSGSLYGVGIPSLTFGYIYNFGSSSTRYRIPAHAIIDCPSY